MRKWIYRVPFLSTPGRSILHYSDSKHFNTSPTSKHSFSSICRFIIKDNLPERFDNKTRVNKGPYISV